MREHRHGEGERSPTGGSGDAVAEFIFTLFPREPFKALLFHTQRRKISSSGEQFSFVGIDHGSQKLSDGRELRSTNIFFSRGKHINSLCKLDVCITMFDGKITSIMFVEPSADGMTDLRPDDKEYAKAYAHVAALFEELKTMEQEELPDDHPLLSVYSDSLSNRLTS